MKPISLSLLLLIPLSLFAQSTALENALNLKGIKYLYMNIERNQSRTVATTFEMSRRSQAKGSSTNMDALKSDLRALMGDFVEVFTKQNP